MAQEQTGHIPSPALVSPRIGRGLVIAFCLAIVWGTVQAIPHPLWPGGAAACAIAALYALICPFAMLRARLDLIAACGLLSIALQIADPRAPATVAAIAAVVLAGSRLSIAPGGAIAAITGLGMIGATLVTRHQVTATLVFSQAPSYFFTFLACASLSRLRREQRRTAALLQEVIAGRDAQVHAARLDEQARLAREMHDVLAHTLAALSIQLEGTRMLAEQRGGDPAVVGALDRVSRLAKEGLLEARRAVSSLRGDSLPGPNLLPSLVESFERDTGVPAIVQIEGEARELPSEASLAIYRTAQEALTNIRKHAEATAVTVTLRYAAREVELRIENRGRPRPSPVPGSGYGLVGMRERAELLGGRLEAGPMTDGFCVTLWIPA